jgi:hypothetical protein
MPGQSSQRLSQYVLLNVAFGLLVGIGYAASHYPDPRLLYVILLFALCSTVLIDFDGINGRQALLALFMLIYFISFGFGDVSNLLNANDGDGMTASSLTTQVPTKAEWVILAGGVMLVLGYRLAAFVLSQLRSRSPRSREWSRSAVIAVGLVFWLVGTIASYRWNFFIIRDTTNEAVRKGLSSISPIVTVIYLIGQMCQPLGMLLLAYAYRAFRGAYLLPLVITFVGVQLLLGFIIDVKGLALLGIMVVIVTSVLVDGKLPKIWLAGFVVFVVVLFPIFQAYRGVIHGNVARTAVLENLGAIVQKTIAAEDKVNSGRNRAQTFLERASVKGSVQIIVDKTGNGVAFQRGYTLEPVLAAFVPKILWSGKPSVPTGQFFNKQFHISDSDDVFISPSHLGELYWNFGWSGVILGMTIIGLICGWIGTSFNVAEFKSPTRVLVTVITIKLLILGFEGDIADIYVVWLRSLLGIGILHAVFARYAVNVQPSSSTPIAVDVNSPEQLSGARPFSNLLV